VIGKRGPCPCPGPWLRDFRRRLSSPPRVHSHHLVRSSPSINVSRSVYSCTIHRASFLVKIIFISLDQRTYVFQAQTSRSFSWLANPLLTDVTLSRENATYCFRTYPSPLPSRLLSLSTGKHRPSLTLNEPGQQVSSQSHLFARNMVTLQHLYVISGSLACLVILGICTLLFSRWIASRRLNPPPGPRPDPFIGNLRQIPFNKQELRFTEWGSIFGTVVAYRCVPVTLGSLNEQHRRRRILQSLWAPHGRAQYLESRSGSHGKAQPQLFLSPSFCSSGRNVIRTLRLHVCSTVINHLIGWAGMRLFPSCPMVLDFANTVV